jgi:hypothetical protein
MYRKKNQQMRERGEASSDPGTAVCAAQRWLSVEGIGRYEKKKFVSLLSDSRDDI